MTQSREAYERLIARSREVCLLGSCASVLGWDRETYMPERGTEHRAAQLALLSGMIHERFTAPEVGEWLQACEASERVQDPLSDEAVNVREIRREYDKQVKLPKRLVEELARTTTLAHSAWVEAREKSDFKTFQPWLEKIVALKQEEADCYGYEAVRYDALLDDYEPGETTANLRPLFEGLKRDLAPLVQEIISAPRQPDASILQRDYPVDRQRLFGEMAAAAFGFDFSAGRLDTVVHPFCTGIGPGDTRITTRFNPRFFNEAFFGILHECGHGLYEQGLEPEHYGTPRGREISLGIHESQSRMWENLVGRSLPFWEHFFPKAKGIFHRALGDVSLEAFVHAVNEVRPSYVRVEADEATYNLHIVLRFELERALIAGDLVVRDVPAAWNEEFQKLFGIALPDDRRGCLQDTHWSSGGVGYFPTYCLGNLYAAQFFEQARRDIPQLESGFARGEFQPLLQWLRENIHRHGMRYRAGELVEKVTGKPLGTQALLHHLRQKYGPMYGF